MAKLDEGNPQAQAVDVDVKNVKSFDNLKAPDDFKIEDVLRAIQDSNRNKILENTDAVEAHNRQKNIDALEVALKKLGAIEKSRD